MNNPSITVGQLVTQLPANTPLAKEINEIRKEVGDEVFFNTLKEYYSTYKFKNVNGSQFVDLWKSKGVDIEKIIKKCK